jgi:hypothetical protein
MAEDAGGPASFGDHNAPFSGSGQPIADQTSRRTEAHPNGSVRRVRWDAFIDPRIPADAGVTAWTGIAATGGDLSLAAALAGAGNPVPIVLLRLGAATLAVGWAPRTTALAGSLPATGGFLLLVIADSIGAPG